jgi:hypothetical protein
MPGKKCVEKDSTATRKVVNQRGTLYVSLPKKFAMRHEIKAGDFVSMVWGSTLRVIPRDK